MSREDGGIDKDLAVDVVVKAPLDAVRTGGARELARDSPVDRLTELPQRVTGHVSAQATQTAQEYRNTVGSAVERARTAMTDIAVDRAHIESARRLIDSLGTALRSAQKLVSAIALDPQIVSSVPFSPVTGARIVAASHSTSATLLVVVAASSTLAAGWSRIGSDLSAADEVLAASAASLTSLVRTHVTTAVGAGTMVLRINADGLAVPRAAAGVVLGAGANLAQWHTSVITASGGAIIAFGAGIVTSAGLAARDTWQGASALWQARGGGFSSWVGIPQDIATAWRTGTGRRRLTPQEIERVTGALLPTEGAASYRTIVGSLQRAWSAAGWDSTKVRMIVPTAFEQRQMRERAQEFRKRASASGAAADYQRFRSISDLLANAGEIDAMGRTDRSVIRVAVRQSEPPVFTVIIPSTKDWYSTSRVPNDLASNISIMAQGDSGLLRAAHSALRDTISRYGQDPASARVMVAGFSQGGITAAAFARNYQNDFKIQHVVTAGSPIGRIEIPRATTVTSFENAGDVAVPRLDLASNPCGPGRTTIIGATGGHSALDYARTARANEGSTPAGVDDFLSNGSDQVVFHDHVAVRDRSAQ
ncbi:hypothetical protein [Rarobacter incanus]|uniref:Alpha/beta hydrolase family protein n=1 Tax=Rarobacter incanus TaxID=153494 RepID=A0A542SSM0_9MICO|nr:hypothetical protein [Rarobacter incanus]TQK77267.1 hypothetical protein FB389_1986 [Rarobacter incanus]